jgi:hypothetical protein
MATEQRSYSGINPGAGANTAKPGSGYNEVRRTSAQERVQSKSGSGLGTNFNFGSNNSDKNTPVMDAEFNKRSLPSRFFIQLQNTHEAELDYL